MTFGHVRRTLGLTLGLGIAGGALHAPAVAQTGATLETTVPPGDNYDQAAFRVWYPAGDAPVQAVLVLVPGSNDDGRPAVEDSVWQNFATRHRLALLGCYFTDKPHDYDFVEEYAAAGRGSGQALLTALASLATQSRHPELAQAPLLLWGMSAGGEFNYEFTAWKPERVAAFIVNKGGIYYSALVPAAARNVPGLFFTGGQDLEFRTKTIVGLFTVNRRAGALWALADEADVAHEVGRSRTMAMTFFDEVLSLRLDAAAPSGNTAALTPLAAETGFVGDLTTKTFETAERAGTPTVPTAWLPGLRTARAWQALVRGQPFDP